jgi:RNA polymerase sigma factor (sigma-70 family)
MFERFTDRARRVVVLAQEEARMLNHNYIGTEHILLGLIHEGEGVAAKALESLGISLEAVRSQVEEIIGQGQSAPTGHIPFTPRAKKVLELSLREALQLGHNYIGTEHILLGLIREGEGVAAQVLQKLGADLEPVRRRVIQLLSGYTEGWVGERDLTEEEIDDLQGLVEDTPEVDELWHEFKATWSQTARERLILHYAPLVKYVVGRAAAGLPHTLERADLVSYGMFGLMDALDKFDVSRQEKFEMYALARIKEAIMDELPAGGLADDALTKELAEELGLSREKLEGQEMRDLLAAINSLSGRQKIVMTLHRFEGLTFAEIGEVLGESESRVRQIHAKALQNLRDLLKESGASVGDELRAPTTDEVSRCPRCRRELAETGAVVTLDLPVQGSDETRAVSFAYCRRCGTWLGTV